jgi:hypothetical protein
MYLKVDILLAMDLQDRALIGESQLSMPFLELRG